MSKELGTSIHSSQFLKSDGGKTKSNAIEIPSIPNKEKGGSINII